jgi:hypothetical protein
VFYLYGAVKSKPIVDLDTNMMCYASGKTLPCGLPIFDYNWELQGIHHTSTTAYKINQATRVDAIFRFLTGVTHLLRHNELNGLLEGEPEQVIELASKPAQDTQQYMYWFQWFTRFIFRYDLTYEIWSRI